MMSKQDSENIIREDAQYIAGLSFIPWNLFENEIVIVTGATGLIGQSIVRALCERNIKYDANIKIVALARNDAIARSMFAEYKNMSIVHYDLDIHCLSISDMIDHIVKTSGRGPDAKKYLIHCISPTSSSYFIEHPSETINTIVMSTVSMLEYCRNSGARMVFLSSMEVYGKGSEYPITESEVGGADTMNVRNSYPQAKQLSEALCAAYASEYGISTCVARLAQTFGAGVRPDDARVFAEFARDCMEKRDIHLLTDGKKKNMYLYIADAVSAILLLAAKGSSGEAYNVANEETLISIKDMALNVASRFGSGKVRVIVNENGEIPKKFPKSNALILDTKKIQSLGWKPSFDLMEMYERLIDSWLSNQN